MTFSTLCATTGVSPKRSSREGATIDTFLVHHMAGTDGPGVTAMMRGAGGRTVSSNYTIHADGSIHGVVPEEDRAWTSGSATDGGKGAAWDRRSITVEIENTTGSPDWYISDLQIQAAARLLRDLRSRHQISTVLGHRDLYEQFGASYPTYCPGPDTVARIVAAEAALPMEEDDDMFTDEDRAKLNELYEDYGRARKGRRAKDGHTYGLIKRIDEAIRNGKAGSHSDGVAMSLIKKIAAKLGA